MKILDFGCGKKKYQSKNPEDQVIGIDVVKEPGIDIVHNLEKFPYPFKNNEFDLVVSSHVLEHLGDLVKVMEEIHRICKPGARVKILVPYFAFYGSFQDPTHKRFFTWDTFRYFTEDYEFNYYTKARFKIIKRKLFYKIKKDIFGKSMNWFINKNPAIYERFFAYMFPAKNFYVELEVVK